MKLHEYQAKKLLSEHGVDLVSGKIAYTPKEAFDIASNLKDEGFYIKAQSSKVKKNAVFSSLKASNEVAQTMYVKTPKEVEKMASFMLGNTLFDDDYEEHEVRKVFVEKAYDIEKSMYLSVMVDSKKQSLVIISSLDVDKKEFVYEEITTATRPKISSFRRIFEVFKLSPKYVMQGKELLKSIYKALVAIDALKIEVTELIITKSGDLLVKEVDVFFDDASLSRQKEISSMIDLSEMSGEQELAYKWDVRYIPFKGNISVMANGVGLGLALADMINLGGGEIAHLIDIGWNANQTKIAKAFQLVLRSINVDGLLIYVYGGSLRCDEVAKGIISVLKELSLEIPLVIRLGGTNEDIAKNLLKSSGLPMIIADDMATAAEQVVNSIERSK